MALCSIFRSLALLFGCAAGTRLGKRRGLEPKAAVHNTSLPGTQFRGNFRDLSLWVEEGPVQSSAGAGLWVVEYTSAGEMSSERLRAEAAGLVVVLQQKLSLVLQGNVPGIMGYDACGGEVNKAVISVADRAVLEAPMPAAEASKHLTQAQSADPWVEALLELVSQSSIWDSVKTLENYTSRNSASGQAGLDPAAEWAAQALGSYGFQVTRDSFRSDYTPQIVAELAGTEEPSKVVVLGAHLDSTSGFFSSPSSRSPGADDNGSGSASVLEFARIIAASGARFRHTLRLCLFTGEEQGLIGSRALASRWRDEEQNIIAMVNVDMMGYRRSPTPITINVMTRQTDPALTEIAQRASATYLPEFGRDTTTGCCSDQQAFHENGFPAMGFFETPGSSVVYPQYHTQNDLSEYIDPAQIYVLAKAAFATTAVMAEILPLSPTPAPAPTPAPPPTPAPTTPAPTPAPPAQCSWICSIFCRSPDCDGCPGC